MANVSRDYADQIAKDRGEAMDELERRNTPTPAASERMIEMMARAICRENLLAPHQYHGGRTVRVGCALDASVDANWRAWLPEARAALSVLAANVSEEMKLAAMRAFFHDPKREAMDEFVMENFASAISAAISAAGDEDRRAS